MGLADTLIVFSARFLGIFIEAAPFLLLGSLTSGLLETFVSHDDLVRFIPRNPVLASLVGGLLGFAFPVGECGVVPVTRRLFRKGLPTPVGITFLLAAPVINPIVIASTYTAFHERAIQIVYLRVAVALVVAVGVGVLFSFQPRPERVLREPVPASSTPSAPIVPGALAVTTSLIAAGPHLEPASRDETLSTQRMDLLPGLRQALLLAADEFFEMGRYLILGSMLAASLRIFVTQNQLKALATNPVSSVLAMQADGAHVLTVEGLADAAKLHVLQKSFLDHGAYQCGFCTSGMLMSAKALLDENSQPTKEEIRKGIHGNLCRCTGYNSIVRAISAVADGRYREEKR